MVANTSSHDLFHREHAWTPFERCALERLGFAKAAGLLADLHYRGIRCREPGVLAGRITEADHNRTMALSAVAVDLYLTPRTEEGKIPEAIKVDGILDLIELRRALRGAFEDHIIAGGPT